MFLWCRGRFVGREDLEPVGGNERSEAVERTRTAALYPALQVHREY